MATILLSIKAEYVSRILSGEKTFEYRKRIPKQSIDRIVIYETSPKKRIVGIADVRGVVSDTPDHLWNSTGRKGGISKEAYMEYFSGSVKAYAFELKNITKTKHDFELNQLGINQPPQSYYYMSDEQMRMLTNCF